MTRVSQYEVLHHFTRKLYEAGLRAGLSARLLVGDEIPNTLQKDPPDWSIGFNGAPSNANKEFYCDLYKVPYVSLLVDPPYRFLGLTASPRIRVGCDDRTGCHLLEQMDFKRSFFLPHAVESDLAPKPDLEKIYDVVMMATFIPFREIRNSWKRKFHPVIQKIMDETVERTFADPLLSFITAYDELLSEAQRKYPFGALKDTPMTTVLEELEIYIKGRDRFSLATSLKNARVHVFGASMDTLSWKDYFGDKYPHITVHGPVSFQEALQIFKQTKVLLNPNLKNKEGAHERVFAGFACGAAVVTNYSTYLEETFKEGRAIIYYRQPSLEGINDVVDALLASEPERQALADNGRAIVMQHHTWDNRLAEIQKQF